MRYVTSIVFLGALAALPAPAEARLVSQSSNGGERVCAYQVAGAGVSSGRMGYRTVTIPVGRACPATAPSPRTEVEVVPSMATLVTERAAAGQKACIYSYLGKEYTRLVSSTALCSFTPN